ncbi:MAG: hypothetical protein VB959_09585, partial [Rhodospirillales bacterium]
MRLLRIGAEKGYMVSQFELGYKFQKGNGVPRSYASALQWYAKAAAQGHPTAMNNIGYLIGQGYGTEKKRKGAGLVFKGRQERTQNRLLEYWQILPGWGAGRNTAKLCRSLLLVFL